MAHIVYRGLRKRYRMLRRFVKKRVKRIRKRVRHKLVARGIISRHNIYASAAALQAIETRLNFYLQRNKPIISLLPALRGDRLPGGSGYVRLVRPYLHKTIRSQYRVRIDGQLPAPGTADVVIIQRNASTISLETMRDWLPLWRQADGILVFEIDDDLFDAAALKQRRYEADTDELARKLEFLAREATVVIASTKPLADKCRTFNNNVHVVENVLDAGLWQLGRPRRKTSTRVPGGPIRIGYIGTPSHDADLDLITPAMAALQEKYRDRIAIEVIGGFQHKTPTFGTRIELPDKSDYPHFVKWLLDYVDWDIGIIPLTNDEFNKSKSNLKFLEYAALNMAIAVSNVETYAGIAKDNVNCLALNNDTQTWVDGVSRLIDHEDLRTRLALAARTDVSENHTLDIGNRKILTLLRRTLRERASVST